MGGGNRGADPQAPSNDVDSLHREAFALTSDDAATVIGICVSLLALVTGALALVICFELLTVLSRECLMRWML
jgi:hypothetical protein